MYFNRDFNHLKKPLLNDLRTLENEGNIYAQFWYEEFDEFRYCRIPFEPQEIVEYVDALTSYDEFLKYCSEGYEKSEALDLISNETVKRRVKEYNRWAKDEKNAKPFVAAAFYSDDLEDLLCGSRKERYEFVDQGFEGSKRELLREMIDNLKLSATFLQQRQYNRPSYEITQERDVHDLLFAVLKPIFPEAIYEEPTEKHAGSRKDIDIVVPEISTGIELKYTKKTKTVRELGDDLKADIESYHIHSACNSLIIVIWDRIGHISDPHNFKKGLEGERSFDEQSFTVEVKILD